MCALAPALVTPDPFSSCIRCRATFKYEGKMIKYDASGEAYDEFLGQLGGAMRSLHLRRSIEAQQAFVNTPHIKFSFPFPVYADDERVYGYVRFETGDELSRRAKFAFITWIGPSVGVLKKAKVSTDKAFMKEVMNVSKCCKFPVRNY